MSYSIPSCRGHTAHLPDSMSTRVSKENLSACPHCERFRPCDCREQVGVFLPSGSSRQTWRLYRWYAKQLRNMNMADFINHANDVRLKFTPDLRSMMVAGCSPDGAVGLNHKRLANGVTIVPMKRTKTRCLRSISYSLTQCRDNNTLQLEA